MEYIFMKDKDNFEDYASGRVLYNAPGTTAFPVRLACELFLRARERLVQKTGKTTFSIYDPCCGGGYLLAVLGILHGESLERITGSDVNERVLELARNNLSLIHVDGVDRRIAELEALFAQFGKESHAGAIESALRIRERVAARGKDIPVTVYRADATRKRATDDPAKSVDLVFADVPYGNVAEWSGGAERPIAGLLEHLLPVLNPVSLVILIADKHQKVEHPGYRRVDRLKIGKRQAFYLEPSSP